MNKIGIVICNYNKCDSVLKCIQSVLESKMQDFDVYVVDNASTDQSVSCIREQYNNQVTVLVNQENLGGSGGFNTGIRKVIEAGYEYLMCLDNDVLIDENAIEALYTFLKDNPKVGMVGSKVYHLNSPEYIQQFGLNIDFDHGCAQTLYADQLDSEEVPKVVYCDTVAACSVMLPVKVVKEVGLLPEDNFIYWDDMEWGYRVKQHGYEVAAYGESCVLHAMGAFHFKNSSFVNYYHWRNNINFFMCFTPESKLDVLSISILSNFFYTVYESMYRKEHGIVKTLMCAFQDAINHTRGKAKPGILEPYEVNNSPFYDLILQSNTYWLDASDPEMEQIIKNIHPQIKNTVHKSDAELRIKKCKSIFSLRDYSLEYCYVDENYNIAVSEDDMEVIKNYPYSLQLFLYMNQPLFLSTVKQLPERERL